MGNLKYDFKYPLANNAVICSNSYILHQDNFYLFVQHAFLIEQIRTFGWNTSWVGSTYSKCELGVFEKTSIKFLILFDT